MAQIVLFHSVLGLRPGVKDFASQLEKAGHALLTPDLYSGEVFDDYETGNNKWFALDIPTLMQQAQAACKDVSGDVVFAGLSNGAALAEILAANHPAAKGAVLMHGALPLEMAQIKTWPSRVPVQLHYNKNDPFRNPDNDAALQKAVEASGATFTEFLYPGNTHLFADASLPDYNQQSARLMIKRILAFLDKI